MKKILERIKTVTQIEKKRLRRVLGVSDLFAIGFGDLGSSIYYALGITALYALGATPIALALAGVVFICTALTYAELTSMFHESGGTASFARHVFNDLISFIAGWGLLFDYIITIAISAFAVFPYIGLFFSGFSPYSFTHVEFTVGLILVLLMINILGVRQSTRMSFILVAATIVTQLLIILVGCAFFLDIPTILHQMRINIPGEAFSPTWSEFWKGTAMAMVAYTGIESIAQLGAEAKTPAKTVPKAVFITMIVLVLMYLGISLAALSAVSPKELGTDYVNDPIGGIAVNLPFGSELLGAWVGIFAAFLLFTASNAGLIGASRLSFNMGEYYQLPRFFFGLHKRFRTPYVALTFFALVAIVVVIASKGQMTFLADLYNFGAMLAFFFAHLSLIVMRIKKPQRHRPFRIPFNIPIGKFSIPLTAVIGCFATMSVWLLIVITKPHGRYFGFAWMLFGIGMYLYYRRKRKIAPLGSLEIERIRLPHYQPIEIKRILVPTRGHMLTNNIQVASEMARLHGAKLTCVHIIEVPASMPLDASLSQRTEHAQVALKRAEAITRDYNLDADFRAIRSRSTLDAIVDLVKGEKFDLVVLSAMLSHEKRNVGRLNEKIVQQAPCRVWICACES